GVLRAGGPGPVARMSPERRHVVASTLLCLLGAVAFFWLTKGRNTWPVWLGCWLVSVNAVTFAYYGFDKKRARGDGRRVPELVLHGLSVAGGSPSAYLAMRVFRHKTIKGKFRILFWCIVVVQTLLVVWLAKTLWW